MNYVNLEKIFYTDKNIYEKKYLEYFNNVAAVKFNFNIKGKQCFFVNNSDITNCVYNIMSLNNKLNAETLGLDEKLFEDYAINELVDEIKITNEIEGVHSTRIEITDVLQEGEINGIKPKRFSNLVKKYKKLILHEEVLLNTCTDIRALYDEIVLPEVLFENKGNKPDGIYFRTQSVQVLNDKQDIIHYGMVPEEKIIEAISQVLNILKDNSINKLIAIAVVHYMIGFIHPFYDGNGRLNRFISSYLLSKELNTLVSYSLSYTIKENIKKYYKIFDTTNNEKNRGDLTPFIIQFLEIVQASIEYVIPKIQEKKQKLIYYGEILEKQFKGDKKHYNIIDTLLINSLFGYKSMDIRELDEKVKQSDSIVRKVIKDNEHLLIKRKEANKILYDIDLNIK